MGVVPSTEQVTDTLLFSLTTELNSKGVIFGGATQSKDSTIKTTICNNWKRLTSKTAAEEEEEQHESKHDSPETKTRLQPLLLRF